MITYLEGKVIDIDDENKEVSILTSGGVGYLVKSACLPTYLVDQNVNVHIFTSVAETHFILWGFADQLQLRVFRLLLNVSGVGPSLAAAIISRVGPAELVTAIITRDSDRLRVPGVGSKTAEKIILELQTKVLKSDYLAAQSRPNSATVEQESVEEAVLALAALGYDRNRVRSFFASFTEVASSAELVKHYLSSLKANRNG